ncbi:MAG: FAD:protein FMN transferase, partial [Clostridia bacterium]
TQNYFNTNSKLELYDDFSLSEKELKFDQTWIKVKEILKQVEDNISLAYSTSDIARYNALSYGQSVEISKLTADILEIAKKAYKDTDGAYNPTVYPLVDLWGFTPRFTNNAQFIKVEEYDRANREAYSTTLPKQEYIDGFCKLTDFDNAIVSQNNNVYTLTKNSKDVTINGKTYSQKLDLGGIGKGYACDLVTQLLQKEGYKYGYFSCGSSSIAILSNFDKKTHKATDYKVGFTAPRNNDLLSSSYANIKTSNKALSSSGDYEHKYIINGFNYCHIINPANGMPINSPNGAVQQGIALVSVLAQNNAYCDCLTTALCVMGIDKAKEFLSKTDYEYSIVTYNSQEETYQVHSNIDNLNLVDSDYKKVEE